MRKGGMCRATHSLIFFASASVKKFSISAEIRGQEALELMGNLIVSEPPFPVPKMGGFIARVRIT